MSKWTVMSLFLGGTGMALIGTLLLTHAQVREILEPFAHERSMSGGRIGVTEWLGGRQF